MVVFCILFGPLSIFPHDKCECISPVKVRSNRVPVPSRIYDCCISVFKFGFYCLLFIYVPYSLQEVLMDSVPFAVCSKNLQTVVMHCQISQGPGWET